MQNRLASYLAPFGVTSNATSYIYDPNLYLTLTEASMDVMDIHDAEGLFIYAPRTNKISDIRALES